MRVSTTFGVFVALLSTTSAWEVTFYKNKNCNKNADVTEYVRNTLGYR